MKRQLGFLIGAMALVLAGWAPRAADAQSTPAAATCANANACVIFSAAYPNGPAKVDLYIDGKRVAANLGLGASSTVIALDAGPHWLQVPAAGSAPSVANITASLTFEAGSISDLVLLGFGKTPRFSVYPIDPTPPATGLSRSRIVNLWPGLGSIDVDLGDPGDKTGGSANARFTGVSQDQPSDYVEAGPFSDLAAVNVFPAGTADPAAAPLLRACPACAVCSYILIGPAGKSKTVTYAVSVFPTGS